MPYSSSFPPCTPPCLLFSSIFLWANDRGAKPLTDAPLRDAIGPDAPMHIGSQKGRQGHRFHLEMWQTHEELSQCVHRPSTPRPISYPRPPNAIGIWAFAFSFESNITFKYVYCLSFSRSRITASCLVNSLAYCPQPKHVRRTASIRSVSLLCESLRTS
jgi:hypothetical protein